MKTYRKVYFSLCLFLAISGRLRTQRELNPRVKFPIYSIPVKQTCYLVMTGMITLAKPSCWWWHCSSVRVTMVKSLLTSVLTTLLWTSPWPWPEWLVTTLWVRNSMGRVSSFIRRAWKVLRQMCYLFANVFYMNISYTYCYICCIWLYK